MDQTPTHSPNPNSNQPIRRKLVIIGDGACGKTSLLSVFAMGEFPEDYEPTVQSHCHPQKKCLTTNFIFKPIQLALWDTASVILLLPSIPLFYWKLIFFFKKKKKKQWSGGIRGSHQRLRPLSYSKSHVILIAFAIDTPDSLENVTVKWIEEVRSICGPTIPVILVGCKKDLRDADAGMNPTQFVQREEAERVAASINARCYMECSALKNEGVDSIFESATRAAMLVRQPAHSNSNNTGHPHASSGGKDEKKSGNRGKKRKQKNNSSCCYIV
ncbi:rho family protein [Puccinia sorghi]|uniref:Rho family protein n=1 Tax=Puccinia sorghi TaxID=27349 RepID=A0A0L6UE58_9BASI|nr:rho family protein [Puccinia sorghi]